MRPIPFVLNVILIVGSGCIVAAQTGGNYVIKDATLEGSAHTSAGGPYISEVRLGQGLAGTSMAGGNFAVGGGFYPPPPPPPVLTPPSAPSALSATAVSKSQIDLSWTDNSSNEAGFDIELCNTKGKCRTFSVLAQTAADVTTFSHTDLMANTTYTYRVRAFNLAGSSEYSNVVAAKPLKK